MGALETELQGFRKMFAEASDQLRSGDAPSDLKVQFMRIIPFEALHVISTHLERERAQLQQESATLPLGTGEQLDLLVRSGLLPPARAVALREARPDAPDPGRKARG